MRIGNRLKTAATAAAKSAAREATSTAESGTPGTARCGSENCSSLTGHCVEIVHKTIRIKLRPVTAALIPARRLHVNVLKGLAPIFLNTKGHRKWKKFFKHFGSFDHAIEAVGFYMGEKIFEAENAFERSGSACCSCRHEPAEATDDEGT